MIFKKYGYAWLTVGFFVVSLALQDGVSASHPVGSLVASALLGAAGVLHVDQTLVVLPDDAALGDHRGAFAGVFGMIEDRSDEIAVPNATSDEGVSAGPSRVT